MDRREFLKAAAAAGLGAGANAMFSQESGAKESEKKKTDSLLLARRPLGKTGVKLSIIGLGGIVVMNATAKQAKASVEYAIKNSVNYFDVAPTYGDAEIKLGPALEPYRDGVFLACKTTQRDKAGAAKELERSLKRLRTDHFDLYQLHGLTTMADVEKAFGKGGAMETFVEARKAGRVKYLGFSAHSEKAALEAMKRFDFDTVLFPVNCTCWQEGKFGSRVVAEAVKRGMGILALKALAKGWWLANAPQPRPYPKCWYEPWTKAEDAHLALGWTLSEKVTAALPPGEDSLFRLTVDLAKKFSKKAPGKLLTAAEQKAVKAMTKGIKPIFPQ